MISFSEFLAESRSAPLYHGTDLHAAYDIIQSNLLRSNSNALHLKSGQVSLTRSLTFAKNWGSGIVFELDQQKLTHNHKIKPFNFFSWGHTRLPASDASSGLVNQYEEAVVGDIKGIDKYIVAIHVPKSWFQVYRDSQKFKSLQKFKVIGY